jgi:dCTP deaminase
MILCDREIQAALHRGLIKITPSPPVLEPTDDKTSPWSSTTLDLRLDKKLTVWEKKDTGADVKFEPPDDPDFDFDSLIGQYAREFDVPSDGHPLKKGQFVLGWTHERIQLPDTSRLAVRVRITFL